MNMLSFIMLPRYSGSKEIKQLSIRLQGRVIYDAFNEGVEIDKHELLGCVLNCISWGVNQTWFLVYKNMEEVVCISPVYEHQMEKLVDMREGLQYPVDIRTLFEMVEL